MIASIIIPAFNAASFIEQAIQSALNQTIQDLEVLVVDDRSTDDTRDIVRSMSMKDARIHVFENEGPQGPSAGRNTALRKARGDWIAVLDADDAFHTNRLERLIMHAEQNRWDAVIDDLLRVDFISGKELGHAFGADILMVSEPIDLRWVLQRDFPGRNTHKSIGFCKPLFSRAALERRNLSYAEDISVGEDFLFLCEGIIKGLQVGTTAEVLYTYSERPASASRATNKTSLVAVNDRVALLHARSLQATGRSAARAAVRLQKEFKRRRAAFWYEQLSYGIKDGDWPRVGRAFRGIDKGTAAMKLIRAAVRRLRAPNRTVSVAPAPPWRGRSKV